MPRQIEEIIASRSKQRFKFQRSENGTVEDRCQFNFCRFESNRIRRPNRGNLLIARQLDFRTSRHAPSVASASPLVKSTTRPRYEINTSSIRVAIASITLLLRSPPSLQRTNIPLFIPSKSFPSHPFFRTSLREISSRRGKIRRNGRGV